MTKKALHKKTHHLTISDVLLSAMKTLKKKKLPSVALDAEVLLAYTLKKDRAFILAHPEYVLGASEIHTYRACIQNRVHHVTVAYITGRRDFYGHSFFVNNHVLIPRQETELLVEEASMYLRQHPKKKSLLDVGTGSGCIALSVAKEIPSLQKIIATDVSEAALSVAKKNARVCGCEKRIVFQKAHMFGSLKDSFDCIVANLPYLSQKEYAQAKKLYPEIAYEPKGAICAGKTGLELFELFFRHVYRQLNPDGTIFLEIGNEQKRSIQRLVKTYLPQADVRFVRDLTKRIRVAIVQM